MSAALAIFQVPLVSAVTLWFSRHLGVAMGLLQSAQGLANVLFAPLMVVMLTHVGWRWAFWGPGIVGGLLLLLLIRFFRNEPAEIGLRPLGADPHTPSSLCRVVPRPGANDRLPPAGPAHICLLEPHRHPLLGVCRTCHHRRLSGRYGPQPGTVPGHRGSGGEHDVWGQLLHALRCPHPRRPGGGKPAMALCFFLQALPIALLFWAHEAWQYLFAVLFGIGLGGNECLPDHQSPILRQRTDGPSGWQMLGAGIGMASGSFLVGCCVI